MGWKILPCHGIGADGRCTCGHAHSDPKDIGKHPALANWQNDASSEYNTVDQWFRTNPQYNIGVMCRNSGFFVIDIDPRSGGIESYLRLEELVEGEIPDTISAATGLYPTRAHGNVRGRHLYFSVGEGENLVGKIDGLPGIDIKYNGYVLLNPSNHVSGVGYEWEPGHAPWEIPMAKPSEKLLSLLRKRGGRASRGGSSLGNANGAWDFVDDLEWSGQKLDLDRFLNQGIDEGSRAVDIYAMACALANKYGTGQAERMYIDTMMQRFNHEMVRPPLEVEGPTGLKSHVHRAIDFVANNPKDDLTRGRAGLFETYLKNVGAKVTTPAVAPMTHENHTPSAMPYTSDPDDEDYRTDVLSDVNVAKDVDALDEEDGGVMGGRTLTDTGNGRRFVDTFGSTVRYTPGLGWFYWNGQYWKPDTEELEVRELAKRLASVVGAEAAAQEDSDDRKEAYNWAIQSKSNARQDAALRSANSDPRIGVAVDNWDRDPYLFGVANGVVDLRTGDLLRGRPDLHITRRSSVAYSRNHPGPRFQQFLDYATYGDKEYQEWLQKAAGYTLTGLHTYDVLFLVYGPPGSGKNVLVESLVKAMDTKQYAFPLDSAILAQGDGKSNPTDMYHWAELRGRRMVWVDELPETERIKENQVKKLTGSSEISARSPGEKPFTFESQAKLWITTNHRPIITDDAMWRRIRPIPWTNVPTTPDPTLKAYLHDPEGGLPAVLAWAVEGAIKLLASNEPDALGWCSVVSDAAEMYRKNEDRLGMFLDEETESSVADSLPIKTIYLAYQAWSDSRSEKPMSQIAFVRKLQDRGLSVSGTGGRAIVLGFRLRPPAATGAATGGATPWSSMSSIYGQ
jgi:P4 family phage/plasmid primase-like protien